MKYFIAMLSEDGSTTGSTDYKGEWDSAEDARQSFCNKVGTPYHGVWWDGAPPYVVKCTDGSTMPLSLTRNELQRIRRRSPQQKVREAAASRVSYWRKKFYEAPSFSQAETDSLQRMHKEQAQLQALRA